MRESCALYAVLLFIALSQPARAWTGASTHQSLRPLVAGGQTGNSFVSHVRRQASTTRTATGTTNLRRHVTTCKLERLPRRTLKRVVPLRPTSDKYLAHFGQTARERRRKVVDTVAVALIAGWCCVFVSRTLLGPLAWRASCFMVFLQAFLRPMVGSYRRASELWGAGGKQARSKTIGALFTGRVIKTGFALASEASDHRTHFQMLVEDEEGRELLFDVPQVPEYRDIRRGMRCQVVVLSRSTGFSELTGITEAFLPELGLFVGRFPLLDKRDLLHARNERDKHGDGANTVTTRRNRPAERRSSTGRSGRRGAGAGDTGVDKYQQERRSSRESEMPVYEVRGGSRSIATRRPGVSS